MKKVRNMLVLIKGIRILWKERRSIFREDRRMRLTIVRILKE
jgi:hypothetical protein